MGTRKGRFISKKQKQKIENLEKVRRIRKGEVYFEEALAFLEDSDDEEEDISNDHDMRVKL